MKATYVKTQLQSVVNISKIVTIHYYEFDKNFVFEGGKARFLGNGIRRQRSG